MRIFFFQSIAAGIAFGVLFSCGANIAFASSDDTGNTSAAQSSLFMRDPLLKTVWQSGANGALVGFGAGASASLIGYSLGSNTEPVRLISGLTGAGFLAGALWGFVEHTWISEDYAESKPGLNVRPEVLSQSGTTGPGVSASFRF